MSTEEARASQSPSDSPPSAPTGAVFLSYASEDTGAAGRLATALRDAGIEVWFDKSELRGGDSWDSSIRRQIKACALFVPVISVHTRRRLEGYFRLEWKLAVDRSHLIAAERPFLLPIVIDETSESEALVPDGFREVQWTRAPDGSVPAAFLERVTRLLSAGAVARAAPRPALAAASAALAVPRRVGRRTLLGAALLALIAIAAIVSWRMFARDDSIGVVAVLPFQNATGDASIEYVSDGISDSLIERLSNVRGIRVISRISAFAFKGSKIEPAEVGRKLGVDALILGTLAQHGSNLAISTELVRARDATHLWGARYARPIDELMQVEGEIAETIARNLRPRLTGSEQTDLTRSATSDPEAYRLYLKGRSYLVGTQQEMDKGIDYFQQAIARAPDYAMPYAGLAEAYTRQAFLRAAGRDAALSKARSAVDRALQLDPNLAEAHSALADTRFYFDWDWNGAEVEYRRALELNPGAAAVHEDYGSFLTTTGRLDDGLKQSKEAAQLDPLFVMPVHDMAFNALVRRDYAQAEAGFRRTIDIDPNWTWGYIKLARTLALEKRCADALSQTEIAERRIAGGAAPLSRSWLGVTYALCGDRARAVQKLDELHALEKQQYVDPSTFADIHAALGEVGEALAAYEKAFADHSPNMVAVSLVSRVWPAVGAEPRFQAIVARMNFPRGGT